MKEVFFTGAIFGIAFFAIGGVLYLFLHGLYTILGDWKLRRELNDLRRASEERRKSSPAPTTASRSLNDLTATEQSVGAEESPLAGEKVTFDLPSDLAFDKPPEGGDDKWNLDLDSEGDETEAVEDPVGEREDQGSVSEQTGESSETAVNSEAGSDGHEVIDGDSDKAPHAEGDVDELPPEDTPATVEYSDESTPVSDEDDVADGVPHTPDPELEPHDDGLGDVAASHGDTAPVDVADGSQADTEHTSTEEVPLDDETELVVEKVPAQEPHSQSTEDSLDQPQVAEDNALSDTDAAEQPSPSAATWPPPRDFMATDVVTDTPEDDELEDDELEDEELEDEELEDEELEDEELEDEESEDEESEDEDEDEGRRDA